MKTTEYSGNCVVTELVFVQYTVDFRPGMVFAETLKRMSDDYAGQCRAAYEAHNRCSLPLGAVKVVSIRNGWK